MSSVTPAQRPERQPERSNYKYDLACHPVCSHFGRLGFCLRPGDLPAHRREGVFLEQSAGLRKGLHQLSPKISAFLLQGMLGLARKDRGGARETQQDPHGIQQGEGGTADPCGKGPVLVLGHWRHFDLDTRRLPGDEIGV